MKTFHLPDLGEGLAEAEIREWYIKEGDVIKLDQPMVSMETAKAVVDVPSPYAGKVMHLHGKKNEIIQTGAPLVSFQLQEGEVAEKPKGSVVGALEETSQSWEEEAVVGTPQKTKSVKAMPAARVLAKEMGVDLNQVTPSGPNGLITPQDVKHHLTNQNQPAKTKATTNQFEPLHGVRRVMAQVMAESHREVAPATIVDNADITNLVTKTDLTVLLLKAMTEAIKSEPALNAWFNGQTLERRILDEVNIGIAMDSREGLFVPVIKNVAKRTSEELRDIVNKYKVSIQNRTIASADMQGGTIILSNFGTIAGIYATPIVVPPTVAILGCGRSRELPVVRNGTIVPGKILPLSLTFDHRAVTGGEATRFLGAVIAYIHAHGEARVSV